MINLTEAAAQQIQVLQRVAGFVAVLLRPAGQPLAPGDPAHQDDVLDSKGKIGRHFLQDDGDPAGDLT